MAGGNGKQREKDDKTKKSKRIQPEHVMKQVNL